MELNKKADANMWWIIIGAVIALVVLIILLVIFTGKTGSLEGGLSACDSKGGICVSTGNNCPRGTLDVTSTFGCPVATESCCLGAPKTCNDKKDCCALESSSCECTLIGNKNYCVDIQQQR